MLVKNNTFNLSKINLIKIQIVIILLFRYAVYLSAITSIIFLMLSMYVIINLNWLLML